MNFHTSTQRVEERRRACTAAIRRPPTYHGGHSTLAVTALIACGWLALSVFERDVVAVNDAMSPTVEAASAEQEEGATIAELTQANTLEDLNPDALPSGVRVELLVPPPAFNQLTSPESNANDQVNDRTAAANAPLQEHEITSTERAPEPLPGTPADPSQVAAEAENETANTPETNEVSMNQGATAVDAEVQLAKLNLPGMHDRITLERWLSQGVISIEVTTSRGVFVAAVDPPSQGTDTPYAHLDFGRPADPMDAAGPVLGSNMRLRFASTVPLDLGRLNTALALQIGRLSIESLAVHFTGQAAAGILSAQDEAMSALSLPPRETSIPTLSNLSMDICFADDVPIVGKVTDLTTGDVLLDSEKCGAQ